MRLSEALRNDPLQRQASSYMWRLAEPQAAARLAAADFALLDSLLHAEEGTVEPEERDRLRAGWQTPGALAAMCRWYAALFLPCDDTAADTDPLQSLTRRCRPVEVPVCVLWGERDGAFVPAVLENLAPWARRLEVHRFTNAGHWLLRADLHTRTAALSVLRDFLQPDRPSTAAVSPP
jgi:pimeloyl-ACP methyl ester carboxylesterase